jgi:hypothetical protein
MSIKPGGSGALRLAVVTLLATLCVIGTGRVVSAHTDFAGSNPGTA